MLRGWLWLGVVLEGETNLCADGSGSVAVGVRVASAAAALRALTRRQR